LNGSIRSSETRVSSPRPGEPPVRFTLSGPSRPYDPVHQAIRRDLADIAEAKHHFAPHYAEPVMCTASAEVELRAEPTLDAPARATMPQGCGFALLDLTGGWAWGYMVDGHVVGYVRRELLELA
jgi:hypothetical protein